MKRHLLLVTIGPVQGFIAQARRTRDLWFGSHLLSEISRRAARTIASSGAVLVFPSFGSDSPELENCLSPIRPGINGKPPQNIANKLLAEVPEEIDPKDLARQVRSAVNKYWRDEVAESVRMNCVGLIASDAGPTWDEQVSTFIEFSAAWTPLDQYKASFDLVERALASRKYLREFVPWTRQRPGMPKSSLDGARETVLRPPEKRASDLVARYRISPGEQLDAIGLVKRTGGEPDQFLPITNIALSSWIQSACSVASREIDALKTACEKDRVPKMFRTDLPVVREFPFDASVLIESRWHEVFKDFNNGIDPASWGWKNVFPVFRRIQHPWPYVACLVADGDRMGSAIQLMKSPEEHRVFSGKLSEFASAARKFVEQDHRGSLVYAGGDDVLAFLPVPEAISCADSLQKHFKEVMKTVYKPEGSCDSGPTLSVGLGIGHLSENMGDLLALGREAERLAKIDRNSLAVLIDKRSGGRRSWRCCWDKDPIPSIRLREDVILLEERLSKRKIYEISRSLKRLPTPASVVERTWSSILHLEVLISLSRSENGGLSPRGVGLDITGSMTYEQMYNLVKAWVDRMLIADLLASSRPKALQLDREVKE